MRDIALLPFCIIPNCIIHPTYTDIKMHIHNIVAVSCFYIRAGEMAPDIKHWPSAMGQCLHAQTRLRTHIHQSCPNVLVALVHLELEFCVFHRLLQESTIWFDRPIYARTLCFFLLWVIQFCTLLPLPGYLEFNPIII